MSTGFYPFKNLVFEGGGVKGVAYGGALEVLEQSQITPQIENVAGTSAGAITATLVSLNYTAAEFIEIMLSLDFKKFEDGNAILDIGRLIEEYGWFKGAYFLNEMQHYIAAKTGDARATFRDLKEKYANRHFKNLHVFGTNLSQQAVQEFSSETTPDVAVADAVRISMSIPFFFASRTFAGDVYCDGGVLNNYPISTFDDKETFDDPLTGHTMLRRKPNQKTLGFHLDNLDQPPPHQIDNLVRFSGAVFDAILNIQNILLKSTPGDEMRTVFINDLGVKTTDFELSEEMKLELMAQGRIATSEYLSRLDLSAPPPPDVLRLVRRHSNAPPLPPS